MSWSYPMPQGPTLAPSRDVISATSDPFGRSPGRTLLRLPTEPGDRFRVARCEHAGGLCGGERQPLAQARATPLVLPLTWGDAPVDHRFHASGGLLLAS